MGKNNKSGKTSVAPVPTVVPVTSSSPGLTKAEKRRIKAAEEVTSRQFAWDATAVNDAIAEVRYHAGLFVAETDAAARARFKYRWSRMDITEAVANQILELYRTDKPKFRFNDEDGIAFEINPKTPQDKSKKKPISLWDPSRSTYVSVQRDTDMNFWLFTGKDFKTKTDFNLHLAIERLDRHISPAYVLRTLPRRRSEFGDWLPALREISPMTTPRDLKKHAEDLRGENKFEYIKIPVAT